MKRLVFMVIPTLFCGIILTNCNSKSELEDSGVVTLSNGRTLHLEDLPWLEKLIDLSQRDKTSHYWGSIWLERFDGQDIFVIDMMLGSGGVLYYFFDNKGASIINKDYEKYHNPYIEAFAGKEYTFVEMDEKELLTLSQSITRKVVVYSFFSNK